MNAPQIKDYYTIPEVADLLGVKRQTVISWIRVGKVEEYRKKGIGITSPYLLPLSEVNRLRGLVGLPALSNP